MNEMKQNIFHYVQNLTFMFLKSTCVKGREIHITCRGDGDVGNWRLSEMPKYELQKNIYIYTRDLNLHEAISLKCDPTSKRDFPIELIRIYSALCRKHSRKHNNFRPGRSKLNSILDFSKTNTKKKPVYALMIKCNNLSHFDLAILSSFNHILLCIFAHLVHIDLHVW